MKALGVSILVLLAALAGVAGGVYLQAKKKIVAEPADETAAPGQLWTCGMHPQVLQTKPGICPICHMKLTPLNVSPPAAGGDREAMGGPTVTIDPVVVQNMGLRVAQVTEGPLKTTVRTVGYFREAQPGQRDVSLKVGGWVRRLFANVEGMHLQKGEPLFEIYSPQLLTAQEELIAARRALDALPGDGDPLVRKEAEQLLATARQKLLLWDLAPEEVEAIAAEKQARSTITFRSPIRGHLVERLVVEGSAVEPGQKLLRLVDHTTLWIDAQVYERQMGLVSIGEAATATALAYPGRKFEGRIAFIHPHVDEATRASTARLVFENPDLSLKPGMYATVEIEAPLSEKAVLAPREAVIDTGLRQIAFVAQGEGRFEPRLVRLGAETQEGLAQVLEGLSPGETVVVSGQFLLDVESRTREAIQKLLSERLLARKDTPAAPPAPGKPLPPVDDAQRARLRPQVDQLVLAYLALSGALAADEAKRLPETARSLSESAGKLAAAAPAGPLKDAAEEIRKAAVGLPAGAMEEVRKRFKPLSDAVIKLAERVPPSTRVAQKLYVVHCPMVPADWLQADENVANPYYGKSMLDCGSVVRAIPAEGKP